MNEEMTSLMHKHLNGALTPAEASTLANALMENPHLAEEFAAMTRLEGDLSAAMKDSERTALYTRRMERAAAETEPAAARKRWPVKSMAAAAGFAVLVGAGWSVLDGLEQNPASRNKPGSSGTGGGYAAMGGGAGREGNSSTMKQKLRRFFIPMPAVSSQPVSQALAHLQTQWRDASPKDDKQAAAFTFALSEKVRQRWLKPDDEPTVSLAIPGVSLLTNLELVAAQSGLKPVITAAGVTMEEDPRAADTKERTWTIPLPKATVASFMRKSAQETAWWKRSAQNNSVTFSMAQAADAMNLEWGKSPARYGDAINMWMDGLAANSPPKSSFRDFVSEFRGGAATDASVYTRQVLGEIAALNQKHAVTAGDSDLQTRIGWYEMAYRMQSAAPADPVAATPENLSALAFSPDGTNVWKVPEEVQLPLIVAGDVVVPETAASAATGIEMAANDIDALVQAETARNTGKVYLGASTSAETIDEVYRRRLISSGKAAAAGGSVDPGAVIRLLTVHGMPAEGAAWDAESGVLTAKGPMRGLRAANAAAVAIQEAASDGVAAEMKMIEWKKGEPPIAAPAEGMVPWISPGDMQTLLKSPDKNIRIADRASAGMGRELVIDHVPPPPSEGDERAPKETPPHLTLKVSDTRRLAGESIAVQISINRVGDGITGLSIPAKLPSSGGWLRFDFPASGDKKAVTALVRLQTAIVDP
jgi:hypothetical protein